MGTTRVGSLVGAAVGVVGPLVLVLVLWAVRREITVYRNSSLIPVYFVPAALALVGGFATLGFGIFLRARDEPSGPAWVVGALGLMAAVPLGVFGVFALLMSCIGVQDGGWAVR